jgi:phosphatidylserine/phosphatidylglycerophosphate/cardiolipin synthase-like enzyme
MQRRLGLAVAVACLASSMYVVGASGTAATADEGARTSGPTVPTEPTSSNAERRASRAQHIAARAAAEGEAEAAFKQKLRKGKKKGKYKGYTPKGGPTFNNPLGGVEAKFRVVGKIINSIQAAPKGSEIRIMSWNMMSANAVTAMLNAQRRGVKISLLMDDINRTEIPNPHFARLKNGLRAGNKGRPKARKSYAKTCDGSCRGRGGQAHSKFYLFSKSGKAKRVLMEGSANLTTAAAVNQWNDIYTFVNNKTLYKFAQGVFDQMWLDTEQPAPYTSVETNQVQMFFSPLGGPNYPGVEPSQALLDQVQCMNAGPGAGNQRNRTVVRVAPDVMRNLRGETMARTIKRLWDSGCDVRVTYTVLGYDVYKILKGSGGRGAVPMRHLVQDFDRDGEFDNYFHLKAITINGRVGDNPAAYYLVNGSSNISGLATISDEQSAIIKRRGSVKQYQKYIDYWFDNAPPLHGRGREAAGAAASQVLWRMGVDPYAHVDLD